MPPIRVADVERKLEIERSSLARNEADIQRHQEEFKEIQKVRVELCDRARKAIQELENQLIVPRKKVDQGEEWSDEELTRKWEMGLANHENFKDVNKARKVQFAYITTGSGAILALTLALLSAKVADGLYKNPAECPGWNISSKSSYIPEEATAAQEYATPNKDATIEAEIATQDEAFLNDSMSEIIEHPRELSPTIVAQNARASRIAIHQGKAVRRSAAGSSMVRSERDEFLNELPPSTNAQDIIENTSSVSGIRGKAVHRPTAGSSMVFSEHDEFSNQLPPSTNAQGAVKSRVKLWWMPEVAARRSAAGSSMVLSERDEFLNELPPSTNTQDTNENASSMSVIRGKAARRSGAGSSMVLSERDEFLNELPPSTNAQDTNENASSTHGPFRAAAGSSMDLSECDDSLSEETRITAQGAFRNPPILSWKAKNASRSSATETSRMRSKGPFPGYYTIAPPNPDYKGGDRMIKVMDPNWEGEPIEPMIELPQPTIQNVAIQTLYPQLFKLEPSCNNEWIKKIFEMPETRQFDLAKDHTFKLDDLTYGYEPERLEAALGQIRGVVARKPCGHCKSKPSKGPFATCVVVPGHDERFFGACCNCVYQQYPLGKHKCTLYDGMMGIGPRKAEAKAKHPLRAASVALRSYFPKLRSIKSLPAEGLKEANPPSAAVSQRQAERMWMAYPRGF